MGRIKGIDASAISVDCDPLKPLMAKARDRAQWRKESWYHLSKGELIYEYRSQPFYRMVILWCMGKVLTRPGTSAFYNELHSG